MLKPSSGVDLTCQHGTAPVHPASKPHDPKTSTVLKTPETNRPIVKKSDGKKHVPAKVEAKKEIAPKPEVTKQMAPKAQAVSKPQVKKDPPKQQEVKKVAPKQEVKKQGAPKAEERKVAPKQEIKKQAAPKPEPVSNNVAPKSGAARPENRKSVGAKPDLVKPVSSKPDVVKKVTPKPEAVKTVTRKPEVAKTVVIPKPEVAKTVTPKPEVAKTVAPKPEVAKTVTPKPEIAKTVTPKAEIAKTVTPKPEIAKTVTPKPEIAKTVTPKAAANNQPAPKQIAKPATKKSETKTTGTQKPVIKTQEEEAKKPAVKQQQQKKIEDVDGKKPTVVKQPEVVKQAEDKPEEKKPGNSTSEQNKVVTGHKDDQPTVEPNADGFYELSDELNQAVQDEVDQIMIKIRQELPDDIPTAVEKRVVDCWRGDLGKELRNVLDLNVTKRLLNIHNPLYVKVSFKTDPSPAELREFLRPYGVRAARRVPRTDVNVYALEMRSLLELDRICAGAGRADKEIIVAPLYNFTLCPEKLRRHADEATSEHVDDYILDEDKHSKDNTKPKANGSKDKSVKAVTSQDVKSSTKKTVDKGKVAKTTVKGNSNVKVTKPANKIGTPKNVDKVKVKNEKEEMEVDDIIDIMSSGIVLDECSGSDDDE